MTAPQPYVIAIIPARGGSKGIPRKNILSFQGKPLLGHTVEQARRARTVNRVVVSTDDSEIASTAQHYGAEVVWRPIEISDDTATSESVLLYTLEHLREAGGCHPDLIVFLQCTSPIRRSVDIDRAVQKLIDDGADSLLSVIPSHCFLWQIADGKPRSVNYDHQNRPRRQDLQKQYVENGSIYVFKPWVLHQFKNRLGGKIVLYEMDPWSAIDINTSEDLAFSETVFSHWCKLQDKG